MAGFAEVEDMKAGDTARKGRRAVDGLPVERLGLALGSAQVRVEVSHTSQGQGSG